MSLNLINKKYCYLLSKFLLVKLNRIQYFYSNKFNNKIAWQNNFIKISNNILLSNQTIILLHFNSITIKNNNSKYNSVIQYCPNSFPISNNRFNSLYYNNNHSSKVINNSKM